MWIHPNHLKPGPDNSPEAHGKWSVVSKPGELKVKPQLEEKENRKYPVFEAVSYKTQVVAGINYFIKVHIGDENFLHLRVFQGLAHENKAAVLVAYQTNKSRQDELEYF
ncbi:Cystatin-B [Fukomys damarensis]|uniref:Cystatin-B n=1 Tax=Fukomys damarensis TaxID=885580 RepID=A0A091DZ43_FUKDA|nr:Cystatin-B [Fukomys damarensis]